MNTALKYDDITKKCNVLGEKATYYINDEIVTLIFDNGTSQVLAKDRFDQETAEGNIVRIDGFKEERMCYELDFIQEKKAELMEAYLMELDTETHTGSLRVCGDVVNRVARATGDPNPPSREKLYKDYRKFKASSLGVSSLLAARSKKRGPYIKPSVLKVALETIDDLYLKEAGASVLVTFEEFVTRMNECIQNDPEYKDVKIPSRATFYNLVNRIPHEDVVVKRQGKKALITHKRKAIGNYKFKRILERVEIDTAHLNIGIVSEEGCYLGPALIYVALDCYSRAVVGYHIQSGKGESSSSVLQCLKSMITPKKITGLGLKNSYPMFGKPSTLVADAGTAYNAKTVKTFAKALKTNYEICTTGSPWDKPFVERYMLTFRSQLMSVLIGYAGKRTDQKEIDIAIHHDAFYTLDELESVFLKYIVDDYHQRKHSALENTSPYQVWTGSAKENPPTVSMHHKKLMGIRGEFHKRLLSREGIYIETIQFNSLTLHNWFTKHGHQLEDKLKVYFDKEDVSVVTVILPNGEALDVKAVDDSIKAGTSLALFKAKKQVKKKKYLKGAEEGVYESIVGTMLKKKMDKKVHKIRAVKQKNQKPKHQTSSYNSEAIEQNASDYKALKLAQKKAKKAKKARKRGVQEFLTSDSSNVEGF